MFRNRLTKVFKHRSKQARRAGVGCYRVYDHDLPEFPLLLERTRATESLARRFGIRAGDPLFHSVVVHLENELPIQVEDRHVNPQVAPDYLSQDFTNQTPNAYLMRVAPLQGVSFEIEACTPPASVGELLQMRSGEPCLVLHRQTHSRGQVASVASLWHPASRYRFAGSF